MAAVIFTRTQIATFASVVSLGLMVLMAVPEPYGEGIAVDPRTGAAVPDAWHRLQRARATGDAQQAMLLLRELSAAMPDAQLVGRAADLMARELEPLRLAAVASPPTEVAALTAAMAAAAADATGEAIEGFFGDVARGIDAVDARAATLHRRLGSARPPSLGEMLALAAEFGRRGRSRAHWRWLVRTFARHPESTVAADALLDVQIAHGRLAEALALCTAATVDRTRDVAFQRRRSQLGAWLGRTAIEADALERLVAVQPDAGMHGRLVEIYTFVGAPEKALPHAIALADGADEIATAEAAAKNALASGFVEEGLDMLTRAAARAVDPSPWLRRVAEFALQDLRVDRVAAELERIVAFDPSADDHQLEALYRRTDRPEALADVLQRRLVRTPEDRGLWDQVVALRFGLGEVQLARTLRAQREVALADPAAFLHKLPPELRGQAAEVRRQALSLALAGEAQGTIVGDVLDRLRPFLQLPEFRAAAEALLARHKDDPRSKPMRIELIDYGRTPVEAVLAAKDLAAAYPDDAAIARLWVERANWADMPGSQREARESLLALDPADRGNRHALAELLDLAGERAQAVALWRDLVRDEGTLSPAAAHLVDGLFSIGAEDEALQLLQQLADDPKATVPQRLQAAEELFFRRGYDRAKVLYASVLQSQPDEPTALLRLGQVHAWTNDPRAARPFFERRLAATDADAALVRFYLGETLWATGEPLRARQLQAEALAALQQVRDPDFTTQSLIATMLARLGQRAEAAIAYRGLVGRNPRDRDLVLDYLDVLVAAGQFDTADALLRHGRALGADDPRLLRLEGEFEVRRGDYAAADRAYSRSIELYGAEAGICSDQGQARYQSGDWDGALASFSRWLQLQADSVAARRLVSELTDQLTSAVIGSARSLRVGDDRVTEVSVGAVLPFDDRLRLNARLGQGHYRGRAAALGARQASSDVGLVDLELESRSGSFDRLGIGVTAAPGAAGDLPIGVFAAAHLQQGDPFASLELRAALHELWTEPAAAVALGGRRSSLSAQAYGDLGHGLWLGGASALELLGIDADGSAPVRDVRLRGEVSVGHRFLDGDVAVASPFAPRQVPAGPSCPFLLAEPADTRAWLGNAWLTWQASRIVDAAELPALLPVRSRDSNLFVALRLDRHLATGFGASMAAHVGADLDTGRRIWGVDAAVTWRPGSGSELSLGGSHGSALGRAGGGDVDELHVEVVLRW